MSQSLFLLMQLLGVYGLGILWGIAASYFNRTLGLVIGFFCIIIAWISTYVMNKQIRSIFDGITKKFEHEVKKTEEVTEK